MILQIVEPARKTSSVMCTGASVSIAEAFPHSVNPDLIFRICSGFREGSKLLFNQKCSCLLSYVSVNGYTILTHQEFGLIPGFIL